MVKVYTVWDASNRLNPEDKVVLAKDFDRAISLLKEQGEVLGTVLDSYKVSVSPEESFIKKALITDTKNLIKQTEEFLEECE